MTEEAKEETPQTEEAKEETPQAKEETPQAKEETPQAVNEVVKEGETDDDAATADNNIVDGETDVVEKAKEEAKEEGTDDNKEDKIVLEKAQEEVKEVEKEEMSVDDEEKVAKEEAKEEGTDDNKEDKIVLEKAQGEVKEVEKEEMIVDDEEKVKEEGELNSEEETTVTSDLDKKIIRQVEYYFGNVNLPRDKFLQEKITEDEGWVTIECLTTFNRLQQLSTDLALIASSLKKSKNGVLEVNDTDLKVRRSPDNPLPDMGDPMVRKASKLKTLYMKGFPNSYTLDDVQDFFAKQDVTTVWVKLKTDNERKFIGSIFVEFTTQEQADKLLNAKELKCDEEMLTVMTRDAHFAEKDGDRKNDTNNRESAGGDDKKDDRKSLRKAGCVIHFKGTEEGTSREDLKGLFGEHAPIAWVDFNRGEPEGFIRLAEEGAAEKVINAMKEANDGKIMLKETELTCRTIEGEEEDNYWKMVVEDMKKSREKRSGGGRGRGRGRGGRRGGRGDRNFKRKRPWEDRTTKKDSNNTDDAPTNEHKRFDDVSADAKKTKVEE